MAATRVFVLVACASLLVATPASAHDKRACVDASEKAQQLRREGKFADARAALGVCVDETCPGVVREACASWMRSLDEAQPRVVLGAQDAAGDDVTAVSVTVDGAPLVDHLDGRAILVDPGEHVFRFQGAAGTSEKRVVAREGDAQRAVTVVLARPRIAAAPPPAPAATAPQQAPARGSSSPIVGYAASGVAVVSLATFAWFGISAVTKRGDLQSSCYGHCTAADVDAVKTRFLVADVALGVTVVAAAVAAFAFLTRRSDKAHTATAARTLLAF